MTESAANSGNANLAENGGFLFFTPTADLLYSFTDSFSGSGTNSSAGWGPSLYDVTDSNYLIGPINQTQSDINGSFSFGPISSSGPLKAGDEYKLQYFSDVLPPVGPTNGGISGTQTLSLTFATPSVAPLPSAAWAGFILLLGSMLAPRWLRSMARQA
ncbi:MAG TPA: hypothetical protein VFW23_18350 [Tepidisphaeraceae bacterium]|nr:hypothetical protein [Tepidisphaeraceae bacterium]